MKILKRHAQLAITLAPRMLRRSMLVDDIVGMTIAGLAMAFALLTMYWAFRSSAQFGIIYIAIYIIGYMFKACTTEWFSFCPANLNPNPNPIIIYQIHLQLA